MSQTCCLTSAQKVYCCHRRVASCPVRVKWVWSVPTSFLSLSEHHSVRAEDDCSLTYTPPHSPDHPSPPHTFTPTMACCHTHTAHLHSPPLPSSTPHSSHITASQTALPHSMVVCHSSLKSQGAPTISEATPEDDSKSIFLSSEPPGGQQFSGPPSLSSSSAEEMSLVGGEEGGGNVQRSGAVDGSGRTERGHSEQVMMLAC